MSLQEKYKKFHAKLPVVVADTLLAADSQIELPLWLVQMFKVSINSFDKWGPKIKYSRLYVSVMEKNYTRITYQDIFINFSQELFLPSSFCIV